MSDTAEDKEPSSLKADHLLFGNTSHLRQMRLTKTKSYAKRAVESCLRRRVMQLIQTLAYT